MFRRFLPAVGAGLIASTSPTFAHGVAGARIFVNTMLLDDPAVSDEASLPTFVWQQQPGSPTVGEYDVNVEFDKRITERFGIGVNDGYTILNTQGAGAQGGFQNLALTLKYQLITNAPHELIVSFGVIREFARTGSSKIGLDDVGSTTPTIYWGKGLGDLPVWWLRPLAVTGTFGYQISDKRLSATQAFDEDTGAPVILLNNGAENRWVGGISVQYSIPYLQSQVRDFGLPNFLNRLTPLVEVAWSSPASRPNSTGTQYLIGVGAIYSAEAYSLGAEILIPGNGQTGRNIGVIAQFHLFLDDLFPKTIGKPLFPL